MAFDFTCLATFHANSISSISAGVGAIFVTISRSFSVMHPLSTDCTSMPPVMALNLVPPADVSDIAPVISNRRFGFSAMIAAASSSASGAMTTSVKIVVIFRAVSASSGRFIATIPPKADTGSHANALSHAAERVGAVATPHGLACLMMAMVGASNSLASWKAASVSFRLL